MSSSSGKLFPMTSRLSYISDKYAILADSTQQHGRIHEDITVTDLLKSDENSHIPSDEHPSHRFQLKLKSATVPFHLF